MKLEVNECRLFMARLQLCSENVHCAPNPRIREKAVAHGGDALQHPSSFAHEYSLSFIFLKQFAFEFTRLEIAKVVLEGV